MASRANVQGLRHYRRTACNAKVQILAEASAVPAR
jgi:hypothetical protein